MAPNSRLRHLAVTAACLSHHAFALPQAGITVPAALPVWVTVDPSGSASTLVPAVITTQGQRATILQPPASLLSTATYTLSPNGRVSTYTGLAPVASATGDSDAGIFLACSTIVGVNEPFCLPKAGSTLYPGRTYYSMPSPLSLCLCLLLGANFRPKVTWSPSYFSPPSLLLQIQALFPPSSASSSTSSLVGLTSPQIPASQGFYAWPIPADFLSGPDNTDRKPPYNLTFLLSYDDPTTPGTANDRKTRTGPSVFIAEEGSAPHSGGGSGSDRRGPNVIAIAVPVVVVCVLLLLVALCFVSWRRHGHLPFIGALPFLRRRGSSSRRRSSLLSSAGHAWPGATGGGQPQEGWGNGAGGGGGGFAAASTRGGPVRGDDKSETDVGIQLTDRDSWSPTGRRNVFREELERQARLRT